MRTTRRRFLALSGGVGASLLAAPRLLRLGAAPARAQAIPGAPSFRGASGKSVVGPVTLLAGVTVLRAQHNGTGNFVVNLAVPNGGYSPQDAFDMAQTTDNSLVYDIIGAYKGGAAAMAAQNADYYLAVTASGAWQVAVEQPLPENISPVQQTSFSGKGQDVTPYFMLPDGISQISLDAPQGAPLLGYLYHVDDLGGSAVQAGAMSYDGRIFDFSIPDNPNSYAIGLPDDGPYVFYVTNDIQNQSAWTVSFA
ncbi:MAG TPA: hypothetical protein VKV26_19060 [Dehalococcoidia bacterium]|nr:hypothetical protein [Dehalococcoidia bacterium]